MSGTASCREIRHSLGVYVLGAIEPGERAQVDEHLATCADCREELASLAGLPALLRRVPTAEAERLAVADQADSATGETPPDHLLPSLPGQYHVQSPSRSGSHPPVQLHCPTFGSERSVMHVPRASALWH